ncbi:MAG: hypothetical protein A3D21_00295 [Nitrospirae bacterium RIFCSPHIGHO2_02_FULL_42_12]|nr:MAG: hypothetical protein A3D21_00295 [Nitrospirae bacterium RIFCSPHIGHO2_02_FULL_42_12]
MGLKTKAVIAIFFAGFFALSISLFIIYFQVKSVLTESIGNDFAETARKTTDRIDESIKEEVKTFQFLALNQAFINGVRESNGDVIEVYLRYYMSYVEEQEEHPGLFVVNDKGIIIANGYDRHEYDSNQSYEPWWKGIANKGRGNFYISGIYKDKFTGNNVFDLAIPVFDPVSKRVVGGIRSVTDVSTFFGFMKDLNFGETGHSMLIDSSGVPLVCPLHPLSSHSMKKEIISLITKGQNGWAMVEDDAHGGENSIIGFNPARQVNSLLFGNSGELNWYVFVRQDPGETFAPVNKLLFNVFLFESAIILLMSLLGFIIVRRYLIEPVSILRKGAEQLGRGDFGYRIDIRTGDELGTLANGFNKMGTALKEVYQNLEDKIKERTTELENIKNYLESILKYSTDMIITTDLTGRIVTFNEGAEQMLGYTREEVIGKLMSDYYFHKGDRDKILNLIQSEEMLANYETQLVRKDGGLIDISLSISLLKDKYGRIIGTVGISKDITDWKKAQKQLREYSRQLESMVEKRTIELEESKSHREAMLSGIADGIVFTDQDNKITFINDAAELIFDIKRDDWIGKNFENAHSPESHKKAIQLIKDMREGKVKSYTSEIISGEKTIFAHFSPIMHGPEYLGVIFIARDITEMKRLQAELIQSEKLALVGKMSSSIAHELRNPLVPIGGFARIIHKKLEEGSPIKKYAEIIIKEIDRLERLLHDLLYYTKEVKPVMQPSNLNEIINELIILYEDTFNERKIKVDARISPEIPLITLDPTQIKQSLMNLLYNAIQAMPDGGILTIESRMEEREGIHYASVYIHDTGCGIPDEVMKRIFDPFYTTKIHGLGLGLTLTKNIIELHGGEIEVKSEGGKGTTFKISLPIPAF